MKLRVAVGVEHGGFDLKNELVARMHDAYEVLDLGAQVLDASDDYPDFAWVVAQAVASGR